MGRIQIDCALTKFVGDRCGAEFSPVVDILVTRLPLTVLTETCIIFNTKFLVFDTKFLGLNKSFIIFTHAQDSSQTENTHNLSETSLETRVRENCVNTYSTESRSG